MAKAKINTGHGRHAGSKASAPAKPQKTQLRTGFRPMQGLNTSGTRQAVPHDASTSPATTGSDLKLRMANVKSSRGRRMY